MPEKPDASNSATLLDKVGRILDSNGIRWATIGALAVAYHGMVRASLDADALISLKGSKVDLEGMAALFSRENLEIETRIGDDGDPLGFVVRIKDAAGNQVDLIGGIRRLDPDFFQRVITDEFDSLSLHIASPEDLIALKIFAGGPKDLEDARGVLDVQGSGIDRNLLLTLCHRFGAEEAARCENLLAARGAQRE